MLIEKLVKNKEYINLIILGIFGCLLLFGNMSSSYLWQDEAQTALISKTVLNKGYPLGTDGKNYFSQCEGAEYGNNYVWKWHTWLQFYVTAASFKLFGTNTYAARFPFALFGLFSVFLLYFFSKQIFNSTNIPLMIALFFLFNVPNIILMRQCRYYSLVTFFSLLALYSYLLIIKNIKFSSVLLIISCFLLYHSHFLYVFTILLTIILHSFIFHRRIFKLILISSSVIMVLLLPFIFWQFGMRYGSSYGNYSMSFSDIFFRGIFNIVGTFRYILPVYIFFPAFLLIFIIRKKTYILELIKQYRSEYSLIVLFSVFTISILALTTQAYFFRYLSPLIPLLSILGGIIIYELYKIRKIFAIGIIFLYLFSMGFHKYIIELTSDYKGPVRGMANYINSKAKPDDIVAITYSDLPLKFYTNCRIVGGLTGEDMSICKNARFVVIKKNMKWQGVEDVKNYFLKNIDLSKYAPIEIDYPDIVCENSESPKYHNFVTVKDAPKVVIYERIK